MPKGCRHDGTLMQDECGCFRYLGRLVELCTKAEVEVPQPQPRTLRRFVARGGKLVEVDAVVRETR